MLHGRQLGFWCSGEAHANKPRGIFDYKMAYDIAKRRILDKLSEKQNPKTEP